MEFKEKSVLVTGAGARGGIGAATAALFAREGASVLITGRSQERGGQVVDDIGGEGGEARFIKADLSQLSDVERLVVEAGEVDVLVNNAASYQAIVKPSLEQSIEANQESWDTNIRANFVLTTGLVRGMLERGSGNVVNISTLAARVAFPALSTYGAQKAAIEQYTRCWAVEWGPTVRVNAVAPGSVATAAVTGFFGEEEFAESARPMPLQRNATPEEIGEAVVFLASDRAAFITGHILAIDGGRSGLGAG